MAIPKRDFRLEDRIIRQRNRILQINNQISIDDICGSISACYALEYLGFAFDAAQIIKDSKDGTQNQGADAFSLSYAIAKHQDVQVTLNINYDASDFDADDQDSTDKFNSLKTTKEHKSIPIKKVLRRYTKVSIPIVAFWRNGDKKLPHFSPLVGETYVGLRFILDDKNGQVRPQFDEFINQNWWNAENGGTSIIIRKRGLINFIKYHFYVTCNFLLSLK